MSRVFNGKAFASEQETELQKQVVHLKSKGIQLRVKTFVFREDEASLLYTRLKLASATRIGISYEPEEVSLATRSDELVALIEKASSDPDICGVMVQKPSKATFENEGGADFGEWWKKLTDAIDPKKDIDCLTTTNAKKIEQGEARILPATVQAVVSILAYAKRVLSVGDREWKEKKVAIIGRSDIVGKPLSWVLATQHVHVDIFGKRDMPESLLAYDIVVSAVGVPGLITQVKEGAIVIDVGSPKGDVDYETTVSKTVFITPVPGGVGPVTVISLMMNIVQSFTGGR